MGKEEWIGLALLGSAIAFGTVAASYSKTPFDDIFNRVGKDQGVDPNLLRAFGRAESDFKANAVRIEANGTKSIGIMQILDRTAVGMGVDPAKLYDPGVNILTAGRLLVALKHELGAMFTLDTWVASYNAGSPNIKRYGIRNWDYVSKVELFYRLYSMGTA